MKFLIISSAPLIKIDNKIYAYAPYVNELEIWESSKSNLEINFACPIWTNDNNLLVREIPFKIRQIFQLKEFNIKSPLAIIDSLYKCMRNAITIYNSMKSADHIHLRCPGNMGLLGCLVQIIFPKTPKTAKYAGNWDPDSEQPWSYNLQKWILKNTFLTKNMKVLVYGNWPNQTKNIKPFFTASYYKSEIEPLYIRNYSKTLHFCFVGSLSLGKQPRLAIDFIDRLKSQGIETVLHIYGDGDLKASLQNTLKERNMEDHVFMYGNQPKKQIKKALKYSHFLILPSKSEGWPKAVAEAMFWGCIPITSPVSCVPWMLDFGKRGFLLQSSNIEENCKSFKNLLHQQQVLEEMSRKGSEWSKEFTLDKFEDCIAELL